MRSRNAVAVFALNRDLANERELALSFEDVAPSQRARRPRP